MIGTIYKITNIINNKVYIGQTTLKNPFSRINRHFYKNNKDCPRLKNAINKYGKTKFKIELICSILTNQKDLNYFEQFFIKQYNCISPNGYNLTFGGNQGGGLSEESKLKISRQKLGKPSKLKGKAKTLEHRLAMSVSRKGKPQTPARIKVLEKLHKRNPSLKERFNRTCQTGSKVLASNTKTNIEMCFYSYGQASKYLNIHESLISRVVNNKQNRTQTNGWKFYKL